MLTQTQEIGMAFLLAAIWLGVGSLMIMQWQVRPLRNWTYKLRLSPSETQRVIAMHKELFPASDFRKIAGYGSALLLMTAAALILVSSKLY